MLSMRPLVILESNHRRMPSRCCLMVHATVFIGSRRDRIAVAEHSIFHSRSLIGYTDFFRQGARPLPPVPQALVRIHPGSGQKTLYLGAHAPTSSGGRHIVEGPPAMERATVVPHQQVTGSPVVLIDEPWLGSEGGQFGEQRAALLWRVPAATCAGPQTARRRPRCRIITRVPWPILRDAAYSRDYSRSLRGGRLPPGPSGPSTLVHGFAAGGPTDTAPPRRRRCSAVTSSRDGVFSAPVSPRVFCAAALVSPRLLPRPRSQALRRALLPQLLRGSRRGTSASFEACCQLLPCILSSMGSRRDLKVLPTESWGQVGFTPRPLSNRC
jgi:hypothetical protein